ncbi:hypothetical protein Tco_1298095 [Tanacetum coccineum]
MQNIPPLLATHLRETKKRRQTLSSMQAPAAPHQNQRGQGKEGFHSRHPIPEHQQQYSTSFNGFNNQHGAFHPPRAKNPPNALYPCDTINLLNNNKEFQFLDGFKVPPHVGYYDEKADPDNFLHVFEGAIRMEKWNMPISFHMFVYVLKDDMRV